MSAPTNYYHEPDEVERQILDLTARGYTRTEIGRRLHLTPTGVGWHLEHLRRSWHLRSNRQLLVLAGQLGWAQVPGRTATMQRSRFRGALRLVPAHETEGPARPPRKGAG